MRLVSVHRAVTSRPLPLWSNIHLPSPSSPAPPLPCPTPHTSSSGRYAFLYDDKMPEEREELRAALKKVKGQAAREKLQVGGGQHAC